jgi:hypothetical protein
MPFSSFLSLRPDHVQKFSTPCSQATLPVFFPQCKRPSFTIDTTCTYLSPRVWCMTEYSPWFEKNTRGGWNSHKNTISVFIMIECSRRIKKRNPVYISYRTKYRILAVGALQGGPTSKHDEIRRILGILSRCSNFRHAQDFILVGPFAASH